MIDTLKVLETRRSCRNFKPDMIPEETLEQIVRAEPMRQPEWENSPRSSLQ